jgi:hypothetical protein
MTTGEFEKKEIIPVIGIDFVYDPAFCPDWYKKGETIRGVSPTTVREYLEIIKSQWEAYKRPVSESLHKHLGTPTSFFWEKKTCHIADRQIRIGKNNVLRGFSKPILVSMIHPHQKWGFLPFFGDLTHELVHKFIYYDQSTLEILEDETARENFSKPSDFWEKTVNIRDEFVTRRATYKILLNCFGEEFADWYKNNESKEVLPL